MDMIEISPPKQLRFCLPNDLQQVLTLTNITLKPFYARIVHSHSY